MANAKRSQSGGVNIDGSTQVGRDVAGRDINYYVQGADPAALRDLEARLNQFLGEFVKLHRQLEEWKDLHNALQDLQVHFSICRSYGLELGRWDKSAEAGGLLDQLMTSIRRPDEIERLMYALSLNWEQCKLTLGQLRRFTTGLRYIGAAYDARAQTGPPLMIALDGLQGQIDSALHADDHAQLAELIGAFAKQNDDYLYQVDKAIRDVAQEINQLPQQIRLTASP